MARFVTGNTFGTTDTVTAAKLNTAVNDAAISTDSVDNNTIELNSNALRLKDSSSKTTGVTFAKMQHISTAQVLGRVSASEGDVEEVGVVIGGSGDAGLLFDNDDMLDNSDTAGGSATRGATQQSIKAYVDNLETNPVNLTLLNNAVAFGAGYEVPSYYRTKDNIVHLRGLMKDSTANPIATLPSGFRPANQLLFSTGQAQAGIIYGVGRVDVKANGDIDLNADSNAYNSLDGVSFLADGT